MASTASADPVSSRAPGMRFRACSGLARVLWGCASLFGLLGCTSEEGTPRSLELERLAFVPSGSGSVYEGRVLTGHDSGSSPDGLLVDRLEVTRALWLETLGEVPAGARWDVDGAAASMPAVGMDRDEAVALAAARGMRLPTSTEWLWLAAGSRGQPYPYGNQPMQSAANTLEVGLGRAVAVGTFASGRTPGTRIADLAGNVWEWCADAPPEVVAPAGVIRFPLVGGGEWLDACAMGGSWLEPITPLHGEAGLLARGLDARHRAVDLGLRCVADAAAYLRERAASWSVPALRERLLLVGESWGRPALPMLSKLAAEPGAPAALGWLREGASR